MLVLRATGKPPSVLARAGWTPGEIAETAGLSSLLLREEREFQAEAIAAASGAQWR